jgi:DNA-directed RNA polymerase subunit F
LIISNEQVQLAMEHLKKCGTSSCVLSGSVSPEELTRIKAHLRQVPDVREAMVMRIRSILPSYDPDPRKVADKMVGRLIGDMVR